uniref:hypothetical protein n=1 Tax=Stappia sp. TaxID=1870903 RepID=UPI003BAB2781
MSNLFSTAGMQIHIGDAPMAFNGTDFVASDFDSVTWTEIGGHTNLGASGDTSELITSNHIARARTRKAKGPRNAGSQIIVMDLDYADAGQVALIAGEKTPYTYPIRLTLNDAPPGGTPSQRLYVALIMTQSEQWDEATSLNKLNVTLEIDSNIVRVAAAEAGGG